MDNLPASWLVPLFTAVGSAFGAWVAVKVTVARLEIHMTTVLETQRRHSRRLAQHNDDLLVHDIEIDAALAKLDIPRARRQSVRNEEAG